MALLCWTTNKPVVCSNVALRPKFHLCTSALADEAQSTLDAQAQMEPAVANGSVHTGCKELPLHICVLGSRRKLIHAENCGAVCSANADAAT